MNGASLGVPACGNAWILPQMVAALNLLTSARRLGRPACQLHARRQGDDHLSSGCNEACARMGLDYGIAA